MEVVISLANRFQLLRPSPPWVLPPSICRSHWISGLRPGLFSLLHSAWKFYGEVQWGHILTPERLLPLCAELMHSIKLQLVELVCEHDICISVMRCRVPGPQPFMAITKVFYLRLREWLIVPALLHLCRIQIVEFGENGSNCGAVPHWRDLRLAAFSNAWKSRHKTMISVSE